MLAIVYLNGAYKNKHEATISVSDRGFLFGDSVYDSTAVIDGKLIDFDKHFNNISHAMEELHYVKKIKKEEFIEFHRQLIKKNKIVNGLVYCQVSRGTQEFRDFNFTKADGATVFAFGYKQTKSDQKEIADGIKICIKDDLRWKMTSLKTNQLLYQTLARSESATMGYDDAWMIDEQGFITEGTSSNAWIIIKNTLITRDASGSIYNGSTKQNIEKIAVNLGLKVESRPFTLDEIFQCDEAFSTSIKHLLTPVISFNGVDVKNGRPGKITSKLREEYKNYLVKYKSDR